MTTEHDAGIVVAVTGEMDHCGTSLIQAALHTDCVCECGSRGYAVAMTGRQNIATRERAAEMLDADRIDDVTTTLIASNISGPNSQPGKSPSSPDIPSGKSSSHITENSS